MGNRGACGNGPLCIFSKVRRWKRYFLITYTCMFLFYLVQRFFMVKLITKFSKKSQKSENYNNKKINKNCLDFFSSDFFLPIYALCPKSAQRLFL